MNKAKNIAACLIIFLMIVIILGCQPTPDDKIVQNKNGSDMYKIINESNEPNQEYDVPTRWEDTFSSNNNDVFININAQIETAGINEYPVYTIIPHEITNEQAGKILDALIGEENLWATDNGSIVSTKEHMEYIILFFQKQLAQAEDDQAKAELNALIDYLKLNMSMPEKRGTKCPVKEHSAALRQSKCLTHWNSAGKKPARYTVKKVPKRIT